VLVHVHQYQEDNLYSIKNIWEDLIHGYDNNPYEEEAYSCADPLWQTYNAGEALPPLNVAPCNLP